MKRARAVLTALAATPLALALGAPAATVAGGPVATPTDVGARVAPRQVLDVSSLRTGEPPRLSWSEKKGGRTVIHHGSGRTTSIAGRVDALAPMGSGHVVQLAGSPPTVRWVGSDGRSGRSTWRTGHGLAVSPRGGAVAFTVARGGVRVIDSAGDRVVRMPRLPVGGRGTPVAVSGDNCVEDSTSNGCTVLVNDNRRRPRAWLTSSHGIVDTMPFRQVSTARGRWVGGITRAWDMGTCSRMTRILRKRWETCDHRFSDLSPGRRADGRSHVLGIPSYGDGFGPMDLAVLDRADGSVVRHWRSSRSGDSATYFDEVWEDADHVLVVTYQAARWAIVRLGLDGSMEYAVPPRRGADLVIPLRLQTR